MRMIVPRFSSGIIRLMLRSTSLLDAGARRKMLSMCEFRVVVSNLVSNFYTFRVGSFIDSRVHSLCTLLSMVHSTPTTSLPPSLPPFSLGVLCQKRWAAQAPHSGSDLKLRYEGLVAAGELRFDPHQVKAMEQLQRLRDELDGYEPASPGLMWRVS